MTKKLTARTVEEFFIEGLLGIGSQQIQPPNTLDIIWAMSSEMADNTPRTNAGLLGCTHSVNDNFVMSLSWKTKLSSYRVKRYET